MRHCIFILSFIIGFVSNGISQKEIESKRLVFHKPFIKFFQQYQTIREIRFSVDRVTDSVRLSIVETAENDMRRGGVYDMNKKGDRYSFHKKYGVLYFPASIYKDFVDPRASSAYIEGRVRYDSVFMTFSQWYESKSKQTDDEMIFEKVETNAEYEKGNQVFAKEMQDHFQLRKVNDLPEDSIVIVYAIVLPNKTVVVDTVLEGHSGFSKSVVEFINKSGPWRPMEACGRKVKAYKKIYARLNSDNSFETEVY